MDWFDIDNYSMNNDIVLDTFSGSGTTAAACKELKRKFIAFEIGVKKNLSVICSRGSKASSNKALDNFPIGYYKLIKKEN